MNLEISPDLEAYVCYAIVLTAGLLAAVQQVRARLPSRSAWRLLETYLLFLSYLAVPLVLFWFLDRTGAINDTSLFAALLVGFGYERILTGGMDKVQLPGEVSRLWQPFVAWADRVANRVSEHLRRHRDRFEDRLFAGIVTNQERFDQLRAVALELATDPAGLNARLAEIEQANQNVGSVVLKRRQARLLYAEVLRMPDAPFMLVQRGIIRRIDYYRYWIDYRSIITIGLFAIIVAGLLGAAGWFLHDRQRIVYYVWRLEKRNASHLDRFRNREHLASELDGLERAAARDRLMRSLRKPGVAVDRVDLILGLLLHKRQARDGDDFDRELARLLVDALRAESVDVRTRIHESLRFLFNERLRGSASAGKSPTTLPTTLPGALDKWVPSQGDSPTRLEDYIRLWRQMIESSGGG